MKRLMLALMTASLLCLAVGGCAPKVAQPDPSAEVGTDPVTKPTTPAPAKAAPKVGENQNPMRDKE